MGRPPKYTDSKVMAKKIDQYFDKCAKGEECTWVNKRGDLQKGHLPIPPTLEDLTLYLGFNSNSSLVDYANKSPDFAAILRRARAQILSQLHRMALRGHVDARYCVTVIRVIDPEYRDKLDLTTTVDYGPELLAALERVKQGEVTYNKGKLTNIKQITDDAKTSDV